MHHVEGSSFGHGQWHKAVRKAHITESELCRVSLQAALGQVDDLGGGVFKKRLNKNDYRAIILTKGRDFWIYEFLFAKKDMANIDKEELRAFRTLAKSYAALTERQIEMLLVENDWFEICKETRT